MEKYSELKKRYAHLPFSKYFSDIYSQNGEDGVLSEIFRRLGVFQKPVSGWCVEFGAWNGVYLSNTFALVESLNWNAVYIESDPDKFRDLLDTAKNFPSIMPICAKVDLTGNSTLERILEKTPIPRIFELLSIDIDSYDLGVWESLSYYKPKVVVIEINSSIPPGILWRHTSSVPGNSFSSTTKVAAQKGYTLVCHTGNLIFVKNSEIESLVMPQNLIDNPELLFMYESEWTTFNPFLRRSTNNEFTKEAHQVFRSCVRTRFQMLIRIFRRRKQIGQQDL